MMQIKETGLQWVSLIVPEVFEDHRGTYVETYSSKEYRSLCGSFVEDDISTSYKNVLRGIHGDSSTYKLISCLYGKFYLVVVNNDPESEQYKRWVSFILSDRNYHQVLVPPKFGNGHLVLSEKAIFHYKQSKYYDCSGQFTIKWNDPEYDIWWPVKNPVLSQRDE